MGVKPGGCKDAKEHERIVTREGQHLGQPNDTKEDDELNTRDNVPSQETTTAPSHWSYALVLAQLLDPQPPGGHYLSTALRKRPRISRFIMKFGRSKPFILFILHEIDVHNTLTSSYLGCSQRFPSVSINTII